MTNLSPTQLHDTETREVLQVLGLNRKRFFGIPIWYGRNQYDMTDKPSKYYPPKRSPVSRTFQAIEKCWRGDSGIMMPLSSIKPWGYVYIYIYIVSWDFAGILFTKNGKLDKVKIRWEIFDGRILALPTWLFHKEPWQEWHFQTNNQANYY